ncbi:DNA cross-link repair protein, putative [Eimeria tenella]|uniref:DNA cross-link repair protein, putative n=1 Tax=Eimeria tenella TaxID=5802 RepID=U6L689_EIMTE|nr:DNA cross-link repair protein, putative [Eimeria tenella]CDJ44718.1 DNA cross-link repair protein, putative [Eimeria tenella]|eukprot:XP_013235466.1 DNA cross-link repair protein, putative [Eimeria tenella]
MVVRLPMGQPVKVQGVYVTLIEANHCPGAVMFLFEGPGVGRSLHCGDFRYCPSMLQTLNPKPPPGPEAQTLYPKPSGPESQTLNPKPSLDRVYLDTTYAGIKASFPPQQEVLSAAVQIATQALQEAGGAANVRFLVGTYTIGKERIALHLARECRLRVFVAPQRRRVFNCLEFSPEDLALFTDSPQEAQVDLVPMNVCGSTFPPRGNFDGIRRYLQTLGIPESTRVVGFVCCSFCGDWMGRSTEKDLPIPTVCEGEDSYNRLYCFFNGLVYVHPRSCQARKRKQQQQQQQQELQQQQQQQGAAFQRRSSD